MDRVELLINKTPPNIKGVIIDEFIILNIAGEDVHYWSPRLSFRVIQDDQEQKQSTVSGLIGPRPAVWTLFMFIYFSIGTIGFFVSSFALSKILLGEKSFLIAAFPLTILFLLTAYFVGKHGEKLAKDQTDMLKDFVREVVDFQEEPENLQNS